jgi:hypothetical protein
LELLTGIKNKYKNWTEKQNKMLTIHRQHHPRADIGRLYVPIKKGGRGLMQVEGAYIAETVSLVEYVENKEDPLIQIMTHQHKTNSAVLQTANKFTKSFQSEIKQKYNNSEYKRKMGRKKDAWTIFTYIR